jgi:hypothetical protein
MEPWDESSSRTCYALKSTLLQMEKENDDNKYVEEMINRIKDLFPAKELALEDEEVLKE